MRCQAVHPVCRRARLGRGFTFTELLFAIIVLGIGFIMVAAMFPVAIQQTHRSAEDTVGSALASSAARHVEATMLGQSHSIPPTRRPTDGPGPGAFFSFNDPRLDAWYGPGTASTLWSRVRGSLILPTNPRYAWVPIYRRSIKPDGTLEDYAELIVIVVQHSRGGIYRQDADNGEIHDATSRYVNGVPNAAGTRPATLEPRLLRATLTDNGVLDTIAFQDDPELGAVGENAFVVVSWAPDNPEAAGRIYRISTHVSGNTWRLAPGQDLYGPAENLTNAQVFVVGRAWPQMRHPGEYQGAVQDVAAYRTFIRIH